RRSNARWQRARGAGRGRERGIAVVVVLHRAASRAHAGTAEGCGMVDAVAGHADFALERVERNRAVHLRGAGSGRRALVLVVGDVQVRDDDDPDQADQHRHHELDQAEAGLASMQAELCHTPAPKCRRFRMMTWWVSVSPGCSHCTWTRTSRSTSPNAPSGPTWIVGERKPPAVTPGSVIATVFTQLSRAAKAGPSVS